MIMIIIVKDMLMMKDRNPFVISSMPSYNLCQSYYFN